MAPRIKIYISIKFDYGHDDRVCFQSVQSSPSFVLTEPMELIIMGREHATTNRSSSSTTAQSMTLHPTRLYESDKFSSGEPPSPTGVAEQRTLAQHTRLVEKANPMPLMSAEVFVDPRGSDLGQRVSHIPPTVVTSVRISQTSTSAPGTLKTPNVAQ